MSAQTVAPDFWNDSDHAQLVTQELASLQEEIGRVRELAQETAVSLELAQEPGVGADKDFQKELYDKERELRNKVEELEFFVLFSGPFDEQGAICSLSAGAGGTDAQDWAEMLERMLLRYCERRGFKTRMLERQAGQEAGIKSSTFQILGRYAYGWLKSEAGVHRLVRISPFDAEAMRHTSFALVDMIPDLGALANIEVPSEDIRIDVFRSSGHGGQSVNTTDSAVRIVHIPTNIIVTCQNERSQQQNKATALAILKSRLAQRQEQEREKKERTIRGAVQSAAWGSQIRSYVLHPYKLVKDHRTGVETSNVDAALAGDLDEFSRAFIKWRIQQ